MSKIKESDLSKLYYSIGEVASMFDVNASLIRFWEKEFSGLKPRKNAKGNRLFTPKEILLIDRIYHLVKERGFTLDGAKKALKEKQGTVGELVESPSAPEENGELLLRLQDIRSKLLKLKS